MSLAPTTEAVSSSAISRAPLPELLAPAGDWDCVKAAVENGAGAIYFGLAKFNARMRAQNFTEADLRTMIAAGVDAVSVQDVGICRRIRELSPDFPIHASTQMTITSAAGIEFARDLGCNLVVLARECSIAEIEKIGRMPRVKSRAPEESGVLPSTRSALPIPASASPANRSVVARPIAANARRLAGCPMI